MNSSFALFVDSQINLSMMKNNLNILAQSSEQTDSSLSITYKKTISTGNVISESEITTTETVKPFGNQWCSKKKTKTFYTQLIPINIYNELTAIEGEIKPYIQGYKTVNLLQIISIVAWHIRKDEGISRLQMKSLKGQVPSGDLYLKELISNQIVIRTGQPIKDVKCYEYSFAANWQSKYVKIALNDMYLIRRLENQQIKLSKERNKSFRGHSKQVISLKLISIDAGFYHYMETEFDGNINQENNIIASAIRITNHDYTCKRDGTSKRLHTNITNMAKDLRGFLRVNGKPLVNIDIKNSQPYLSTLLLTHPEQVACFAKDDELAKLLKEIKIPKSPDIAHYIELVTTGGIYEFLMVEFSKEGLILTRTETKGQVLRILYAKNWMPKNPENRLARIIFKVNFPTVHKVFSKIRGKGKDGKNWNFNNKFLTYRRFAILLQRIESHLVLDVIMKRVYKEWPNVFAMTIHDSILTVNERNVVDSIFEIMVEELEKFVGFAPTLKKEGFFEEN